eukprot:CAMPEP_0198524934 /NCGR_PEP_ID=MMETSP1462-20131121/23042_1 /TAXON_ID=1333877 /ORGANISM="Brandtodinium nutriculum, Strain RCC3387" /LENGTH=816 /DNA_ID=CAMNT_0044254677 /DNA_START=64 /DNA_END=2514 /DNA_ORIENTATION=-
MTVDTERFMELLAKEFDYLAARVQAIYIKEIVHFKQSFERGTFSRDSAADVASPALPSEAVPSVVPCSSPFAAGGFHRDGLRGQGDLVTRHPSDAEPSGDAIDPMSGLRQDSAQGTRRRVALEPPAAESEEPWISHDAGPAMPSEETALTEHIKLPSSMSWSSIGDSMKQIRRSSSTSTTGITKDGHSRHPGAVRLKVPVQGPPSFNLAKTSLSSAEADMAAAIGQAVLTDRVQVGDTVVEEGPLQRLVSLPGARGRLVWDVTGVLFVGYDGFMIPFMQAFYKEEISSTLAALMLISTIFWTLDIPMSFLVGYHSSGLIEMRVSRIARKYLMSWFVPDVVIATLDWLFICLGMVSSETTAGNDNSAGLARVARTVRVFRMLRIVRLLRLPKLFRRIREMYAKIRSEMLRVVFQVSGIMSIMLILTHFVACGWYAMGTCMWGDIAFCVQGEDSWTFRAFGTLDSNDRIDYRYGTALHWAASQFTVAGSEISPGNTRERMYAVCMVWFGLMSFAVFVSSITTNMTQFRQINTAQFAEEEALKTYMSEHKISVELGRCIMDYFLKTRHAERHAGYTEDVKILGVLPDRLRLQLRIEVSMPVLCNHPFFHVLREINVMRLSQMCYRAMCEVRTANGQEIFSTGAKAKGLIFNVRGSLRYILSTPDGSNASQETAAGSVDLGAPTAPDTDAEVPPDSWVAEAALWIAGWRHRGCLVSSSHGEAAMLFAEEFKKIMRGRADASATDLRFAAVYAAQFVNMSCDSPDDVEFHRSDLWGTSADIAHVVSLARDAVAPERTSRTSVNNAGHAVQGIIRRSVTLVS